MISDRLWQAVAAIGIKPKEELLIEIYRVTGHAGTGRATAVRITYRPTGVRTFSLWHRSTQNNLIIALCLLVYWLVCHRKANDPERAFGYGGMWGIDMGTETMMTEDNTLTKPETVTVRQHHAHNFAMVRAGDTAGTQWCCHCRAERRFTIKVVENNPNVCRANFVNYAYDTFGDWDHECIEREIPPAYLVRPTEC